MMKGSLNCSMKKLDERRLKVKKKKVKGEKSNKRNRKRNRVRQHFVATTVTFVLKLKDGPSLRFLSVCPSLIR